MGKKSHNMSVAMSQELHDFLRNVAEKKDTTVSGVIRELVEKYLKQDVDTIILKIPMNLRGDADGLKKWLEARSAAIVKTLGEG